MLQSSDSCYLFCCFCFIHCVHVVSMLCPCCAHDAMPMLCPCYANAMPMMLCPCCVHTVPMLCSYRVHIVYVLCACCVRVVSMLCCVRVVSMLCCVRVVCMLCCVRVVSMLCCAVVNAALTPCLVGSVCGGCALSTSPGAVHRIGGTDVCCSNCTVSPVGTSTRLCVCNNIPNGKVPAVEHNSCLFTCRLC